MASELRPSERAREEGRKQNRCGRQRERFPREDEPFGKPYLHPSHQKGLPPPKKRKQTGAIGRILPAEGTKVMDYHPTKLKKDGSLRMGGGRVWVEREVKDSSRGPICGQVPARLRKRGSIKSTYERPAQKGGREGRTQDGSRAVRRGGRVTGGMRVKSQYPNPILFWERRDGTTGTGRRDATRRKAGAHHRVLRFALPRFSQFHARSSGLENAPTLRLLWMCCKIFSVFAVSPVQSWVRLFSFQAKNCDVEKMGTHSRRITFLPDVTAGNNICSDPIPGWGTHRIL